MPIKLLFLALLLPTAYGCISRDETGENSQECDLLMELFVPHGPADATPEHVHGLGCGLVLRGCVWVDDH